MIIEVANFPVSIMQIQDFLQATFKKVENEQVFGQIRQTCRANLYFVKELARQDDSWEISGDAIGNFKSESSKTTQLLWSNVNCECTTQPPPRPSISGRAGANQSERTSYFHRVGPMCPCEKCGQGVWKSSVALATTVAFPWTALCALRAGGPTTPSVCYYRRPLRATIEGIDYDRTAFATGVGKRKVITSTLAFKAARITQDAEYSTWKTSQYKNLRESYGLLYS